LTYRQFGLRPADIMRAVEKIYKKYTNQAFHRALTARLCDFLKIWILVSYQPDIRKAGLLPNVLQFIEDKLKANNYHDESNTIKLALLRVNQNFLYEREPKKNETEKDDDKGEKQRSLLEIPASTLAEQLTLKESKMYRSIQAPELLNLAWKADNKESVAPNVVAIINRTNKVSYWVAWEICMFKDSRKRVAAMKRFIRVAWKCFETNNFNTTMEVMGGLNNVAVQRLKKTWEELPEKETWMWQQLSETMETKNNYAVYRTCLVNAKQLPCVPFLGVFLRDLTFAQEANDSVTGKHINFEKIQLLGSIIQEIQQFQKNTYNLRKQASVLQFLHKALKLQADDDAIYDLSLIVEPKEEQPHA